MTKSAVKWNFKNFCSTAIGFVFHSFETVFSTPGVIFPRMLMIQVTSYGLGVTSWMHGLGEKWWVFFYKLVCLSCCTRSIILQKPSLWSWMDLIPLQEIGCPQTFFPSFSTTPVAYRNSECEHPGRLWRFSLSSFSLVYKEFTRGSVSGASFISAWWKWVRGKTGTGT